MDTDAPRRKLRLFAPVAAFIFLGAAFLTLSLLMGWGPFSRATGREAEVAGQNDTPPLIPGMPVCYPMPTAVAAASTPTSLPDRPVMGLAWFHKPPDDGTTPEQLAAENSYIHLTGPADIPYRNELRDAGYNGPIFTYVTMNAVEGPGPYRDSSAPCDTSYTPNDNQLAFNSGDFCKYIHNNESWFLHNADGARIVDDYFGSGRYSYVMNPADPGWRAFAAERLRLVRDEWLYDGIWLDNVDVDRTRVASELTNSDGTVREYSTDRAWSDAVAGWLAEARAALGDYPLWANLIGGGLGADSWDAYAPYLDGAMDESFAVQWLDDWRTPAQWRSQIQRAERWLSMGKGLVAVGQGPQDDLQRMRFSLASYLLVANAQQATFRYTRFDTYYSQMWLYPEYESARSLGAPTGSCREVSPNVWRRDFERGYVEVDLVKHTGDLVVRP